VACGTLMKCCPEPASQKVAFHNSLILLVPGVGFRTNDLWFTKRVDKVTRLCSPRPQRDASCRYRGDCTAPRGCSS